MSKKTYPSRVNSVIAASKKLKKYIASMSGGVDWQAKTMEDDNRRLVLRVERLEEELHRCKSAHGSTKARQRKERVFFAETLYKISKKRKK